jgi:hypothetical protein
VRVGLPYLDDCIGNALPIAIQDAASNFDALAGNFGNGEIVDVKALEADAEEWADGLPGCGGELHFIFRFFHHERHVSHVSSRESLGVTLFPWRGVAAAEHDVELVAEGMVAFRGVPIKLADQAIVRILVGDAIEDGIKGQ